MRRFYLNRIDDETGISGTGRVADGVEFNDGTCVLHWNSETHSTTIYNSIEDVEKIHSHNEKTKIVWLDVFTEEQKKELKKIIDKVIKESIMEKLK